MTKNLEASVSSSDRQKWEKIFNALVHMLQTQQTQLESLAKERKVLEDRIKLQFERWASDVQSFEDQIAQMKNDLVLEGLARSLHVAKSELLTGSKQREASVYKLKLDHTDNELADLKEWLDCLRKKFYPSEDSTEGNIVLFKEGDKDPNTNPKSAKSLKEKEHIKILESEIKRLKNESDKLSLDQKAKVSSLLSEKDFIWNQYKTIESHYTDKLRNKHAELGQANEKISQLLSSMEQLQSQSNHKDQTIDTLRTKLAGMESETNKMKEVLDQLRNSRSAAATPMFSRCTLKPRNSGAGGSSGNDKINVFVKKEPSSSQASGSMGSTTGHRSSKRKNREGILPLSETPKLFTASFKVPKLKSASPLVV